jgi:hypothetical protein
MRQDPALKLASARREGLSMTGAAHANLSHGRVKKRKARFGESNLKAVDGDAKAEIGVGTAAAE